MSVDLSLNSLSSAEIVTPNGVSVNSIGANNNSIILFYNITTESKLKYIPLLIKNREVKVIGVTGFKQSNLDQFFTNDNNPLDAEGWVEPNLDLWMITSKVMVMELLKFIT